MEDMIREARTSGSSKRLALWGAALMTFIALIHLVVIPEYAGFAAYLGVLFFANFAGSAASAIGIYRRAWWGWPLGLLMAGGAFIMYIESRTIGLPGLNEGWLDPPGVLSLILEATFVTLFLRAAFQQRVSGNPVKMTRKARRRRALTEVRTRETAANIHRAYPGGEL